MYKPAAIGAGLRPAERRSRRRRHHRRCLWQPLRQGRRAACLYRYRHCAWWIDRREDVTVDAIRPAMIRGPSRATFHTLSFHALDSKGAVRHWARDCKKAAVDSLGGINGGIYEMRTIPP